MKIFVTMEGGLCQGVSTDDPALVGVEYVVIDYDVEGTSDEITIIEQSADYEAEAVLGGGTVDLLQVKITDRHELA